MKNGFYSYTHVAIKLTVYYIYKDRGGGRCYILLINIKTKILIG